MCFLNHREALNISDNIGTNLTKITLLTNKHMYEGKLGNQWNVHVSQLIQFGLYYWLQILS